MNKLLLGFVSFIILSQSYAQNDSSAFLDINNIKALVKANGNLFDNAESTGFEVPINSGKTCIFNSDLWVGGIDQNNALHVSGKYASGQSMNYFFGPISNNYDINYDNRWNRVWKLSSLEIEYHKGHWTNTNYEPIEAISTWPAHGLIENGEMQNIAPFYDFDGDGSYNPLMGDYPLIHGDQAIFAIFNDMRNEYSQDQVIPVGMQIHLMAYAFDQEEDELLYNAVFVHYDIFNLSQHNYNNTYIGILTDPDIGYSNDDYIGCDVKGSSFYAYNGKGVDGSGQAWGYGDYPPAISTTFLAGPYLDLDQIDNTISQSSFSYNGVGFGDEVIDNERMGMTNFMQPNIWLSYNNIPDTDTLYYNFMRSIWQDHSHLEYGGNGHIEGGTVGPECNFMFPGDSDPENWGTNGNQPNGGYNQDGIFWTEQQIEATPNDRRGFGACGPFNFETNQKQVLDIAFIYAQSMNYNDNLGSVTLLRERIAEVRDRVANGEIINLHATTLGEQEEESKLDIHLFPNPANDKIRVKIPDQMDDSQVKYTILSNAGILCKSGILNNTGNINTSDLNSGVYFVRIFTTKQTGSQKLIIK